MAKSTTAGMPAGMVKIWHDNARSCSHDGQVYTADAGGDILVPAEAAAALASHGFTAAPRAAARSEG